MHLHFVFPRWHKILEHHPALRETLSGYDIGNFRMAGLGVSTAAGAVPEGNVVTLSDENTGEVRIPDGADLVCIGFFTPQAVSAYRTADACRAQGLRVLAGGVHPTVATAEALQHFDAVVRGPVEGLWPAILHDAAARGLAPTYEGSPAAPFAQARRELFASSQYLRAGVVQTARGCAVNCPFCVLPPCSGTQFVFRPIPEVLEDIFRLRYLCFFFADENLLFADRENRDYREELMRRLIERKNRCISFTASYPQFVRGLSLPEMELLSEARLRQVYLVLGLHAPLCEELRDDALRRAVVDMQRAGIEVLASFTLGHDEDTRDVTGLITDFCASSSINLAEFVISTPFPGTASFLRMQREGRLLHRDWDRYNAANVVFQPLHETPEALTARFLELWRSFYQPISKDDIHTRYARGFGAEILRGAD